MVCSESIGYLFEEVRQLPILSTPSQELWLGVLIKAPQRLLTFGALTEGTLVNSAELLKDISTNLLADWSALEHSSTDVDLTLPPLDLWINEALSARESIYRVRRSKVRNFIRELHESTDSDIRDRLSPLAHSVVELICLLPSQVLHHLSQLEQMQDLSSQLRELEIWLKSQKLDGNPEAEARQRAKMASDALVVGYLRCVLRIARSFVDQGLDYSDLAQEGFVGLMKAAERFDYRIHARFATYASNWIWQSIGRAIADQSRAIRLPVHVHEQLGKYRGAQQEPEQVAPQSGLTPASLLATNRTSGTEPDEPGGKLIAIDYGRERSDDVRVESRDRMQRLLELAQPPLSLDMRVSRWLVEVVDEYEVQSEQLCLADFISYFDDDVSIDAADEQPPSLDVWQAMEFLTPRQREVLSLRFGLHDGVPHTLEEIGEKFGLTRERIRQIEAGSLSRLRHPTRVQALKSLFDNASCTRGDRELPQLPPSIRRYIEDGLGACSESWDQAEQDRYCWLDSEIASLPGGDWRKSRLDGGTARCNEIQALLRLLGAPAHYSTIAEELSTQSDTDPCAPSQIYTFLVQHSEAFLYLGEGVFTLVEWEKERTGHSAPVLPFCPTIPPGSGSEGDWFFEVAMRLCDLLSEDPTLETALHSILVWAGIPVDPPKWVLQSILSSYYLIGLIPYLLYERHNGTKLDLCLPAVDVQSVRQSALMSLTDRLTGMPEFWWLFQQHQPAKLGDLRDRFIEVIGVGLDDVANRLKLLTSIGAAHRDADGRFRLTSLGEGFADQLKSKPASTPDAEHDFERTMPLNDRLDWADLSVW